MSSAHGLSMYLKDWDQCYDYISAYGGHIALWAILSAVTVYRREISCNRSYHEDDEDEDTITNYEASPMARISCDKVTTVPIDNDQKELMTEKILEGAGLYCSGMPLLNFAALLRLGFDGYGDCGTSKKATFNDLSPEDLLDRVGTYSSSEPFMATIAFFTIWKKAQEYKRLEPLSSPSSSSSSLPSGRYRNHGCDPLENNLPPDVHVHIASFLHPRDVVTLSCVSKAYHTITSDPNNSTSAAVWKTLWHRDYAWIVFRWNIGKQAFQRSECKQQWAYSKDFYFLFGQSYLDYVLAGHNTLQSCLVGIHSHIYDITPFLFRHPGSPDTLMVHSGRDATGFFDDMGHSVGARKLAMSMCVLVNRSAQSENKDCGLFPTAHTKIDDDENDDESDRLPPRLENGEDSLLTVRRRRGATKIRTGNKSTKNGGGTLHQMRTRFLEEREQVRNRNRRKYSKDSTILGHEVNTYFDPFTRKWRIWYTDTDLQTIYLPAS